MLSFVNIVLFALCIQFAFSRDVYKAAVVDGAKGDLNLINNYGAFIKQAAKLNADILVLPADDLSSTKSDVETCRQCVNNYDEIVKTVSNAAKAAKMYVVTHVYEKIKCQNGDDLVRSNLVIDRNGDVVSVYRKPIIKANCNTTYSNKAKFSTDFGVTFGVLMEEDLVIQNVKDMGLRNYILLGAWGHQSQYLSAPHFASSWAFITKSNLISTHGVYGNTEEIMKSGNIIVKELEKLGNADPQIVTSPAASAFPEDLSHYIIRPLNLELSVQGYQETVCHGRFCCQFYVKTDIGSKQRDVTYGLVAFDGVLDIGRGHILGTQSCAVVACAGLYKRSCFIQSENNSTNVNFEKISISGNFSKSSIQFPTFLTTAKTTINNFKFLHQDVPKHIQINTEIREYDNLLRFGIFSRDYKKDFVSESTRNSSDVSDFSNYISSENVQEFFDYIWIRLRIVIFVVSIYILEMM